MTKGKFIENDTLKITQKESGDFELSVNAGDYDNSASFVLTPGEAIEFANWIIDSNKTCTCCD